MNVPSWRKRLTLGCVLLATAAFGVVSAEWAIASRHDDVKLAAAERYERQHRADKAASAARPKPKDSGAPLVHSSTPVDWDSGITEEKSAPIPHGIIEIENGWSGTAGTPGTSEHRHLSAYAGSSPGDPSQGLIVVLRFTPSGLGKGMGEYRTPQQVGEVRIVAADGNLLTLRSATGVTFRFDADQERFV